MSSAQELDLRDGKKYPTGYYLNEFIVPYRKLVEAGYEPVIANPQGDMPVMDVDGKANALAKNWPYAGYRVTVFSTGEEQALEGPGGLGGNVQFYPVNALAEAGAHVDSVANWHSNVVIDRELITGQQPMSAPEFCDVLVKKLDAATL